MTTYRVGNHHGVTIVSTGDGLGYGPCVGCGQLWPCAASRTEVS